MLGVRGSQPDLCAVDAFPALSVFRILGDCNSLHGTIHSRFEDQQLEMQSPQHRLQHLLLAQALLDASTCHSIPESASFSCLSLCTGLTIPDGSASIAHCLIPNLI